MVERTNEPLWEQIKNKIMKEEIAGTKAGEWSARKAQLAVKRYKDAGGGYKGNKSPKNELVKWTKQEWNTKSGLPSHITGERYLPKKAIKTLTPQEYSSTSKAKRKGMKEGKQHVPQPKSIQEKLRELY